MASLINKSKVKRFALDFAAENRTHTFTRVSADFLNAVEADFRNLLMRRVSNHPSTGKTLT